MAQSLFSRVCCLVLLITGVARASAALPPVAALTAPALPAASVAGEAVRDALVAVNPAAATSPAQAAQARSATISQQAAAVQAVSPIRGRVAIVRATAYNSLANQTDSTPFITATGTRTRPGVVALSRDLLRMFPYGTKIMIEDLSGRYSSLLRGRVFVVEDTMAARKTGSLDIWMPSRGEAMRFGARQVRITAVR